MAYMNLHAGVMDNLQLRLGVSELQAPCCPSRGSQCSLNARVTTNEPSWHVFIRHVYMYMHVCVYIYIYTQLHSTYACVCMRIYTSEWQAGLLSRCKQPEPISFSLYYGFFCLSLDQKPQLHTACIRHTDCRGHTQKLPVA